MLNKLKQQLQDHLNAKPKRPKSVNFIFRDTSPEAIAYRMHTGQPSLGLMADEGGQILNGRIAGQLPMLNELWSGGDLYVARRDSESFNVKGGRLTLGVMVQAKTFNQFIAGRGQLARDNGFLARCLICFPQSTQGFREDWSDVEPTKAHVKTFQARLTEILESAPITESSTLHQRLMLEFSPEAKFVWVEFANGIERNLKPGGAYAGVRDAASKTAENTARMAALFHYFEGRSGPIQRDSVEQAARICEWYLCAFREIFDAPPPVPQVEQDAMALDNWMRGHYMNRRENCFAKNSLRQYGPNALRSKSRLDAALNVLTHAGRVMVEQNPRTRAHQVWLLVDTMPYIYSNITV
jgi:hypothetical protein